MTILRYLGALVLFFLVTACTIAPAPTITPRLHPPAIPAEGETHVTLKMAIRDNATKQPLMASQVFLNDELIFENVFNYEVRLPGDTRQAPSRIRIEAPGYVTWEQNYRHFWRTNKVYEFPADMVKPE